MLEAENDLGHKEPARKEFIYPPIPEPKQAYEVVLFFYDNLDDSDIEMFKKIQQIARTERRTIEQQVLYLLDGVLGRTVV